MTKSKEKLNVTTQGVEVVDIENYTLQGKKPPINRHYKVKVDREKFLIKKESIAGREILEIAGKIPVEQFQLRQKMRGGNVTKISLDEKVDLTIPGIEKFITIPLDQTEG